MEFKLKLSPAPHIKSSENIEKIMYTVVIALAPALVWSVYVFGLSALKVILVTTASTVLIEYLTQKFTKQKIKAFDGSAIVTGLLLAMNLPSSSPVWLCIVGAFFAIIIGKMVFGGLGNNIFNPALVARVALLISFPVEMTSWTVPFSDSVTGATPLATLNAPLMDLFIGNVGGSLGEISTLWLLVGALLLLFKGYIKWDIPFAFIGSTSLFVYIVNLIAPETTPSVLYHILSGGLILGAFFMATDMVTSPLTTKGRLIFGIGCGVITALIRIYGSYPEGVSFSIILMNAFVPMIDRYIKPRVYGNKG